MEKFVTQEECESRRSDIIVENSKQNQDISKLWGEIRALNENVKTLITQNKWFMGIVSSILGGLMIWLITKGI